MVSHYRRTNHIGTYPGSGIVDVELVFILCTLLKKGLEKWETRK